MEIHALDVTSRHPCSKKSRLQVSAQMGKRPVDLRLGEERPSRVNAFYPKPFDPELLADPVRPDSPGRFSGFLRVSWNRLPPAF